MRPYFHNSLCSAGTQVGSRQDPLGQQAVARPGTLVGTEAGIRATPMDLSISAQARAGEQPGMEVHSAPRRAPAPCHLSLWREMSCFGGRPPSPAPVGAEGRYGLCLLPLSGPFPHLPLITLALRAGVGMGAMRQHPRCAPLSLMRNRPGHTCRGFWARRRAGGQNCFLPGAPLRTRFSEGQALVSPHNPGCDIK